MLKLTVIREVHPQSYFFPPDDRFVTWRNPDGSICAHVLSESDHHSLFFPDVGKFLFNVSAKELIAFADPKVPSELIEDTYHRVVLPMGLQVLGTEVLHASAVLFGGKVIALCAPSGTGKSTSAFSLWKRGFTPWADDVVAFDVHGPQVNAIPLPFRMRLRPDAANFLDKKQAHLYSKSQFRTFASPHKTPVPLGAILALKRLDDQDENAICHPKKLTADEAIHAVLSHAWCFSLADEERKRKMMTNYLDLVAAIPVFEIPFHAGLNNLSALVDALQDVAEKAVQ